MAISASFCKCQVSASCATRSVDVLKLWRLSSGFCIYLHFLSAIDLFAVARKPGQKLPQGSPWMPMPAVDGEVSQPFYTCCQIRSSFLLILSEAWSENPGSYYFLCSFPAADLCFVQFVLLSKLFYFYDHDILLLSFLKSHIIVYDIILPTSKYLYTYFF